MVSKERELKEWCADVRARFRKVFGQKPVGPSWEDSILHERMMRCGIEARYFEIGDDSNLLIMVAHHSLLLDSVNLWENHSRYSNSGVYGLKPD